MHPQPGRDPAGEIGQPHVLNDHRVHPGRLELAELIRRGGKFFGENEDVKRHVGLHAVVVEEVHHGRQIVEIIGPHPRVERRQPEKHGIRAVRDGRADAVPIAGRGEKFG